MIFDLKVSDVNSYAPLVDDPSNMVPMDYFAWDGKPMVWPTRPKVQKFFDKKRKVQQERADLGWFCPGSIALSRRAYDALHSYLEQFGELLQLDCADGEAWLYNCTKLIDCVDYERSEKLMGFVRREVFFEDNVPMQACIFRDPLTAGRQIYLNQAAKDDLEKLYFEHQLTGGRLTPAGTENY